MLLTAAAPPSDPAFWQSWRWNGRADGMAAAELAGLLTKKRDDICLLGLLDTLEYLRRGGRISRTAALTGGCSASSRSLRWKTGP